MQAADAGDHRPAGVCLWGCGGDWAGGSEESSAATNNFVFSVQVE